MKNVFIGSRKIGLITVVGLVLLVAALTILGKGLAREEKKNGSGVEFVHPENDVIFIDEPLATSLPEDEYPTGLSASGPEKFPGVQSTFTSPNQVYILTLRSNGNITLWTGKDKMRVLNENGDSVVIGQISENWYAEWPDPVNDDLVIVTLDDNEPFEVDLATFLPETSEAN